MNIVSITDFGAQSGAKTLQTAAIQQAIDHVFLQGGGEVIVPSGEFLTGDLRLRSHVTLHLLSGARLVGSRDFRDYFHYREDKIEPLDVGEENPKVRWYPVAEIAEEMKSGKRFAGKRMKAPGRRWFHALIRAFGAEDVSILGEEDAIIDGNNCYDPEGEEGYRGPHGIAFLGCRNIRLSGYTVRNSSNWAHIILASENIAVDHITVLAGHDGVHARLCNNLTIRHSHFHTGDDSVAGYGNLNVLVEDCVCNSSCSAFRFGGTNVRIRNCEIYGPGQYMHRYAMTPEEKAAGAPSHTEGKRCNCLSAFTYFADASVPIEYPPSNIMVENCRIRCVDRFLHYNFSGNEEWQTAKPLSDITFSHVTVDDLAMPMTAFGAEECPVSVTLSDVSVRMREETHPDSLIHAAFFKTLRLQNVTVEGLNGNPLARTWRAGEILTDGVKSDASCEALPVDVPFAPVPV